eukprot:gene7441-11764_t
MSIEQQLKEKKELEMFNLREFKKYETSFCHQLNTAATFIHEKLGDADIAVVMGSGLNDFYELLQDSKILEYKDIPEMPMPTISGHKGKLVMGTLNGRRILCFAGRTHSYEGISFHEVTFQVRLAVVLGIKIFGITNATGGIAEGMYPGCIMAIKNHFKFLSRIDPLRELSHEGILDISRVNEDSCWDEEYFELLKQLAKDNSIKLFEGNYCWTNGPSFETPHEVKMARQCEGSCVGMSTVPEVLVAKACGLRTFGISIITNLGAGLQTTKLNHEEVMEMGKNGSQDFQKLLKLFLENVKLPENHTEKKKLCLDTVEKDYVAKPFPFLEMASTLKIAAGTVIKKLKHTSDVAVLIHKSHLKLTDSLIDKKSINFTDIPNFPLKKHETESDVIITGKTKEGKQIYFIASERLVGYPIEEATFLSLVLYELGIKFVISAINCSPVSEEKRPKGNVVFLKDFMNFTYASRPFKLLYPMCDPHPNSMKEPLMPERLNKFIGNDLESAIMMGFYSSNFPTKAERKFAETFNADVVGITAMTPAYSLRYLGVDVISLGVISKKDNLSMNVSHLKTDEGIDSDVIKQLETSISSILSKVVPTLKNVTLGQLGLNESIGYVKKTFPSSERSHEATNFIKEKLGLKDEKVEFAMIDYNLNLKLNDLKVKETILLSHIPHLQFHGRKQNSKLALCEINGKLCLTVLNVSYSHETTHAVNLVILIRAFHLLGVKNLFLSSSLVSCDESIEIGSICVVDDHINFTGRNQLIGPNLEEWGPRFPDMSDAYQAELRKEVVHCGETLKTKVKNVNVMVTSNRLLYSPAVSRAAKGFDCQVINSISISEVLVARHCQIDVCSVGIVTKVTGGEEKDFPEQKEILSKILTYCKHQIAKK